MLKNYLKVAVRNLLRSKSFTAINMAGLTLGVASCLLIVLYVYDELGYDRYNQNAANIYRANLVAKYGANLNTYAAMPGAFGPYAKKTLPEVREAVRLVPVYDHPTGFSIRRGSAVLQEKSVIYADSTLFRVFTFPLVAGNPATALTAPYTAVITERYAKKYFGSANAVGQTLVLDDSMNVKVTGVMEDMPRQSHFVYDIFISMASLADSRDPGWGGGGYNTYLLLAPGAQIQKLETAISDVCMKTNRDWMGKNDYLKATLMPLADIHLQSNLQDELGQNSSMQYVYMFSVIAVIILLTACVNFMNLSTARSTGRAKEVGVRKVLGSPRRALILQFLTESTLVTTLSTILGVVLAFLLLPLFNSMVGKQIAFSWHIAGWLLPASAALMVFISLAAGSYPAFFLSAFKPVQVLKGKLSAGFKGGGLRSVLVVVQFAISVFLIAGTLVIYKQLHFIQTKNLGYNRSRVLIVKNTKGLQQHAGVLKQKIQGLPGVSSATFTAFVPTGAALATTGFHRNANPNDNNGMITEFWPVDVDYIKTLGMQVIQGRDFSATMATDSSAIVINEAAAKFLGFKQPLNQTVYQNYPAIVPWHIIGVVRDFNFKSLRQNVTPVAFHLQMEAGALNIKLNTGDLTATITAIKAAWKAVVPNQPFEYAFMDTDFDALYHAEMRTGNIFLVFTALAIAIACLGLFGLSAYAAAQRTKEVGIRKVLGAGIPGLVGLLSGSFIKLVAIAFVIAAPAAYFAMQWWLQGFAFRTGISWWVVPLAGLAALFIAMLTISSQSIKAALANPIDSLRTE